MSLLRFHLFLLSAVLLPFTNVLFAAEAKAVFREDFGQSLSPEWKPFDFGKLTDYRIVSDGTNRFLHGHANNSASGLAHALSLRTDRNLQLRWRWRIDRCPPGSSNTDLATFDHSVRVFVAFATLIGPPKTINYVWASRAKVGDTFKHPSSSRARFIVLQSGDTEAGQWMSELRDVTADWKKLFPGEKMPQISAVGLMTDSDGTKSEVNGSYANFALTEE